ATWGFHRLAPDAARHVVRAAAIRPGDLVVDLGAGHGALTAALVDAGARVVAVEVHPGRLADLRHRFAGRPVTVVDADIDRVRLPRRAFRVVANPPWARAETVRAVLLRSPALVRADLVLPRWLVHRWAAGSSRIDVGCSLRAESFVPPAPTGSAVAVVHGRRN
ncbi:MAG: rRNA adenine N-6-methyltransferase family protein, partial [Ilumatobacteraceae bacterium]